MKQIQLLILLMVFNITGIYAQFSPATIQLKDNRSLTGFIKNLRYHLNPQEIILYPQKEDKNPQPVPYESIKEVQIEGEGNFIVALVKKYTNELEFDKIVRIPDFENKEAYVMQTLFLKVLVKGNKMNLYTYKDASRSHYFIQKPGGEIETLRYLRSLDPVTKTSIKEYRYYLQQLLPYVSGNIKLENKLETLGWKDNSMIKIANEINANTKAYALYEGRTTETSLFFIGAGANMSSFSVADKNDFESFYKNMSFNTSTNPVISLGTELGFNSKEKGFRLQVGLSAFPFNTTGTSVWNSNGTPVTAKINAKGMNITLGPALKYKFGKFEAGTGANLNITTFSQLKGIGLPPWAIQQGVFAAFGGGKAGVSLTLSPYVMANYMFTSKHGIGILFAPQQKNVKFYEGANLKLGYASLSYIFRIAKKD